MITSELLTDLKEFIPEARVIECKQDHPLGNCGKVGVFPISEREISDILKYAYKNGLSVNVEGRGTKRGYGGLNETADILISLSEYTGIVEHVVGDMTITVRSGANFKELQDYLAVHNQRIPLDPFRPELATIGGIISSNESGPKRLGYGSSRDAVIGLRVVYPDGKVIRTGGRVVKNVAGYDMNKLFIGSMGTLGILSEITLKLRPLPNTESLMLVSFPHGRIEEMKILAAKILDSMLEPITLELFSPRLAERLTGQKFFMLAIGLEDVESSVKYQENFIRNIVTEGNKLQILTKQDTQTFWKEFYGSKPNPQPNTAEVASIKIGVVNMDAAQVIKESQHLEEVYNVEVEAHGGLGHGLCHVNLKGDSRQITSSIQHIREFALKLGGYAVVKHLPFALRKEISVWGEQPSYYFLLEAIKTKVDPKRILNPKRFVGGI